MSDPKQDTQKDHQSPDMSPPKYKKFRKSNESDMSGSLRELELEPVRFNALQDNFATKADIAELDKKLSKEITDSAAQLSAQMAAQITSCNRHNTLVLPV
ncbi:MAG: hypothetical protein LBT40_04835 [Deltaproteobacteria bacterium]|jgi:hypothetical protein|nr:hypothetical protein [Deltaproteobacteria bacterium]